MNDTMEMFRDIGGILTPTFGGSTYVPEHDKARLTGQLKRVQDLMRDAKWRTLKEISQATGDQLQAISARLRDLRKAKFGAHTVDRRRRGEPSLGLWEYRVAN